MSTLVSIQLFSFWLIAVFFSPYSSTLTFRICTNYETTEGEWSEGGESYTCWKITERYWSNSFFYDYSRLLKILDNDTESGEPKKKRKRKRKGADVDGLVALLNSKENAKGNN